MISGEELSSRLGDKDDNVRNGSTSKIPSNIDASPPSFDKVYGGRTTEKDHHCHLSENSSTSHLGYGDIMGGDESSEGVKDALSGSMVSPQISVPTGVEGSAHNQSAGHADRNIPIGAETGMLGMIPLLNPTHTNSNFTSTNGIGQDRTKTRRGGNTRASGIHSSTGRLSDGVNKECRPSSSSLAEGKEPALHSHGGLTTATFLKLVTFLGALCSAILVWIQYDTATGRLCPNGINNPCLDNPVSMALLTIAKMCAGALFPSIIVTFLSKCYTTRHFLNNSWLSLVVNFEPTHKLHTYFGLVIMICSIVHSLAHITRLALERKPELLYFDAINRSGVAAFVLLLPTTLPMVMRFLKSKWTFELRKVIHLAFIPFIIAVCFHGIILRFLGAILLIWYLVDRFYFTTRMTFLINRPNYKIVGRGTLVRFNLPDGYHFKPGAYVQVNCPAISASEWHPFSLFPVPGSRPRGGFHIEAVGDWTKELFRLSLENPRMPLWITAAQPSVLEQMVYYDNVILVCTGAGITPGVSLIERFASRKNIHLLWLSREAGMVAMLEKQLRLVRSSVHVTGSPSTETKQRLVDLLAPSRSEVVATTAASSRSRSGSNTAETSMSGLSALEAGDRRAKSLRDFSGALRDEKNHHEDDQKDDRDSEFEGWWGEEERSRFEAAASAVEGSPISRGEAVRKPFGISGSDDPECVEKKRLRGFSAGRGRQSQSERKDGTKGEIPRSHSRNHSRSRSPHRSQSRSHTRDIICDGKRSRGLHPVSVCFGRPNIERYITETVEGTAVMVQWADQATCLPKKNVPSPFRQRQALVRLNTNQLISKMDLMSADLSVVAKKVSSMSNNPEGIGASDTAAIDQSDRQTDDNSKWLVLYCGANVAVEKALAATCSKLKITWRKEYFSAW